MRTTRQVALWLEAAAWMVVVFSLSGDSFASSRTLTLLQRANELFHWALSEKTLLLFNAHVRKTMHFAIYFVLGLLFYRALAGGVSRFILRCVRWTLLVGLLYALTDEFHQSFTRFRTPALYDAGLDFVGVVAAQFFIYVWSMFHAARMRAAAGNLAPAVAKPETTPQS